MTAFYIDDLQAAEPESLPTIDGIVVDVYGVDGFGLPRVSVEAGTREAVIEYVRANWGDEDGAWFAAHVEARIRELPRI